MSDHRNMRSFRLQKDNGLLRAAVVVATIVFVILAKVVIGLDISWAEIVVLGFMLLLGDACYHACMSRPS